MRYHRKVRVADLPNEMISDEEKKAAEDYRKHLQELVAKDWNFPSREDRLRWVDENRELLDEFATVSWGPRKPDFTFSEFMAEIQGTTCTNQHDDPLTHYLVASLCKEVERACEELRIPLRSGVAYGAEPTLEISAQRYAVAFTNASVVSLSSGFITFCNHLSKAFALSLPHEPEPDRLKVTFNPTLVLRKIASDDVLKQYWGKLIGLYAFGSGPVGTGRQLISFPASITRAQLLFAMERFAVAHEYAHHIAEHGKRQVIGIGLGDDSINEEFEADLFALSLDRYIADRDTEPNLFSISGGGAVLLLKSLECVRRARKILLTGDDDFLPTTTHPRASDRSSAFDHLDEQLPPQNREDFRLMRRDFEIIVEEVFERLKPIYVEMHRLGVRPLCSATEWLPN